VRPPPTPTTSRPTHTLPRQTNRKTPTDHTRTITYTRNTPTARQPADSEADPPTFDHNTNPDRDTASQTPHNCTTYRASTANHPLGHTDRPHPHYWSPTTTRPGSGHTHQRQHPDPSNPGSTRPQPPNKNDTSPSLNSSIPLPRGPPIPGRSGKDTIQTARPARQTWLTNLPDLTPYPPSTRSLLTSRTTDHGPFHTTGQRLAPRHHTPTAAYPRYNPLRHRTNQPHQPRLDPTITFQQQNDTSLSPDNPPPPPTGPPIPGRPRKGTNQTARPAHQTRLTSLPDPPQPPANSTSIRTSDPSQRTRRDSGLHARTPDICVAARLTRSCLLFAQAAKQRQSPLGWPPTCARHVSTVLLAELLLAETLADVDTAAKPRTTPWARLQVHHGLITTA